MKSISNADKLKFLLKYAYHANKETESAYRQFITEVNEETLDDVYLGFKKWVYPFYIPGVKNSFDEWIYDKDLRNLFNVVREQFIDLCMRWNDTTASIHKHNSRLKQRLDQMGEGIVVLFTSECFKPYYNIYQSILNL